LNLPTNPKEFRNQEPNFSVAAHLPFPGTFYEDRLGGIGDIASKKEKRKINKKYKK